MNKPARRRCKKCKKVRAASKFSNDSTRADGKFPWCMACQQISTLPFQNADDPLNGHICPMCDTPCRGHANRRYCCRGCKERAQGLKINYNLTPKQFKDMVAATGGKCPVCGKRPTQWQVDHNHRTGKVTGVVCKGCNVGALAMTYHDTAFVKRLLRYLEKPPAAKVGADVKAPRNVPSKLHKRWQFPRS